MAVYRLIPTVTAVQFLVAAPPWPANVTAFLQEPSPPGGVQGTYYKILVNGVYQLINDTDWVVTDTNHVVSVVPNATFVLTYAYVSP
jgi:hypothetical protein